jgi:DNA-3-methyladenine glycosylase II
MRRAVEHLKNADPVMARIIDQVGPYRPKFMDPAFHSLARSIVYQQLSGRVAAVIFGRLVDCCGEPLRPSAVLRLTEAEMRAIGLSKQKVAYIRDLAAKARGIRFAQLQDLSDEGVIERLTTVKGIGVWTAHMFLMFALRRPDVLPTLDLGVRSAAKRAYALQELPKHNELQQIGEPWRPYRSVASWYLWRSLELKPLDEDPPERATKRTRRVTLR